MPPKLVLYEVIPSPPVRAVKMLSQALDLELELRTVDLRKKEQYTPEYLKINPNHTVPTLDDNGLILWDSHAIMMYLMDKYAKNDSMYPKDVVKRAKVNQLLFCNSSIFGKFIGIAKPILYGGVKEVTNLQKGSVVDSYESLERILDGSNYVTGNDVTIADLNLVATLTSFNLLIPIDFKQFPNIAAWLKRMEALPYYEPNAIGLKTHAEIFKRYLG